MSGYKRVNFYELCRLCATNQPKDKTHIFHEEGKKIQLQNKIQSCLSLTVCENDSLPKVVCSKCLRTLENCYIFRQECVTSESMLSSYFKNFRYTEDFKRSGKVYIKDTTAKLPVLENETPTHPASSESVIYSVLPQIMKENKFAQNQTSPLAYNLNTFNLNQIKQKTELSNVVVNANGEVLNIAQIVDFESLINQNLNKKSLKILPPKKKELEEAIVKIDLTDDYDEKPKKVAPAVQPQSQPPTPLPPQQPPLPLQPPPVPQPTVIYNNMDFMNFQQQSFNNGLPSNNMVICSGNGVGGVTDNQSTVNLTALNQDLTQNHQFSGGGRIVSAPPTTTATNTTNHKTETIMTTNNNSNNSNCCAVCHKTFKRREHLQQHVKLHSGFRPYVCENCNKSFMRKEHLLRHKTSHSGQKNFTCNICDKSFSRNDNLLKHKKTHDKQASYTCEICQKHFVMKHYYIAHKLTHDHDGVERITNVWNALKA